MKHSSTDVFYLLFIYLFIFKVADSTRRQYAAAFAKWEKFCIRKNLCQLRQPAQPFTLKMIHHFFDHLYSSENGRDGQLANLCTWRTVWRVVLEFYTLGRFSDISSLRCSSLRFIQQPRPHLLVHFEGGKNDQVQI